MLKLIELTLTAIGKITAAISLGSSSERPILKTNAIQQRMERIQAKIQGTIDAIADATKAGTPFAEHCDKYNPASSNITNLNMWIVLPDGLDLNIGLDVTTDGYTPKHRDIAELVVEAMDPVLTEIEEIWAEDGADIEQIAAWRTDAEGRIAHGFGLPMHHSELVGATAGHIAHGRDAAIG